MPFTISASVNVGLPGAVDIGVSGDPGTVSSIVRIDQDLEAQPVRNYDSTGSGLETVVDCEAPLGRAVTYRLLDGAGNTLAVSNAVTVPAPADNRSLLRSVLKPTVAWMWAEPVDETGVTWRSSTRSYEVIGSDTPVIVAEVRQRHEGTMSLLCKSRAEADQMVRLLRDGLPMLLRHSPCAWVQTRDMLFYALDVQEQREGRAGWRVLSVDYQTTAFVPGDTLEPPASWTFGAMSETFLDFAALSFNYPSFEAMALNDPGLGVV